MRHGKKQAVRTTLPAWLRHALAFNFIEGMHFNKQFAVRFQPLRAMTDEALRISSAKDIQFPKRHHNEIKGFRGVVCTNILLNVVNIQVCGLRLLASPCDGCRREIYACAVKPTLC